MFSRSVFSRSKRRPQTTDLENADFEDTDLENADLENTKKHTKRVGFFVTKLHPNHLCDFRSIYRPRTCLLASISSVLPLLNFSNEYTFYCKWLRIPHLMIFQLILFSILCKRKLHLQSKQNRVGNPQRVRHLGNFGFGKLNILMNLNRSRQFWALLKSSFSH